MTTAEPHIARTEAEALALHAVHSAAYQLSQAASDLRSAATRAEADVMAGTWFLTGGLNHQIPHDFWRAEGALRAAVEIAHSLTPDAELVTRLVAEGARGAPFHEIVRFR